MTTGEKFLELSDNRLIELDDLGDRFFDYLDGKATGIGSAVYDSPGVLGELGILYDAGTLTITGSARAVDGLGNFLLPSSGHAYCEDVPFEDAAGVTYEITIHRVTGPMTDAIANTMRSNADTGQAEYIGNMEYIGESGAPDSVAQIGDDLVFVIDSLCEAGVSHAGRKALVFLNVPESDLSSIGLPIVDVEFSGGQNKATVLADKLGQSTVSLTASDYTVIVLGPTIRRNSSLAGMLGYVLIGTITDGVEDTSGQAEFAVTLANLNNAFNSFAENQVIPATAGAKADTPSPFWAAASVTTDTLMLVFGGVISAATEATLTNAILEYDSEADAWSTKVATVPDGFNAHMAAARVGDIVYIAGGHDGAASVTDALRRYDIDSDSFLANGAAMPAARHGGALVAFGDVLYYIGGDTTLPAVIYTPQASVFKYDIGTDSWSEVTGLDSIGLTLARCSAVAVGSKIYVPGGFNGPGTYKPQMAIYTPELDTWELGTARPESNRYAFEAIAEGPFEKYSAVAVNGAIHVFAGDGASEGATALHYAYSIAGDRWARLPDDDMPKRYGAAAGVFGGLLYIAGGRIEGGPTASTVASVISGVRSATADGSAVEVGSIPVRASNAFAVNTLPDLLIPRVGASVCSLGSGFLIAGGRDLPGDGAYDWVEMYWPRTQTQMLCASMPAGRMMHGAIEHQGRALIFSGLIDYTLQIQDRSVLAYSPQTNTWAEIVTDANGMDRWDYAIATDGKTAYFVGGIFGGTGLVTEEIGQVPLSNLRVTSGGDTGLTAGNGYANGMAAVVDGTLFIAVDDTVGLGPTSLRTLEQSQLYAGSPAVARELLTDDMADSVFLGGVVEWNGELFIYSPNAQEIYRHTPGGYDLELVADAADGVPERYGPHMVAQDGKLYLFGGSTVSTRSDATTDVFEIVLPEVAVARKVDAQPSNFTTGLRGNSAGFRTGDVFGLVSWSPELGCDFIRMNAEI